VVVEATNLEIAPTINTFPTFPSVLLLDLDDEVGEMLK